MIKTFIPTYLAKSIFDIDPKSIVSKGYRYLFLDLDNTLDSYSTKTPSDRVIKYIAECKKEGIIPIIVSNNTSNRVKNYGASLDIEVFSGMLKPTKGRLNKIIKEKGINKKEVLMVGDQIFTDVMGGNRIGVTVIFTEKIYPKDQIVTRLKRPFERPIKNKIYRKNLSKVWEN